MCFLRYNCSHFVSQTLKQLEDEMAGGRFFESLIEQQLLNAPRATVVMTPGNKTHHTVYSIFLFTRTIRL